MTEEKNNRIKINPGMLTIIVLLICQLIGFAFMFGTVTQQVSTNRELIQTYQTTQINIINKLDDLNSRITKIETLLLDGK